MKQPEVRSNPRDPRRLGPVLITLAAVLAVAVAAYGWVRRDRLAAFVGSWLGPPAVEAEEEYAQKEDGPTFDHGDLTALLAEHVDGAGWVDYPALLDDSERLDRYLESIAGAPFEGLGRDHKLALLINAYNAFTLRLILDHWHGGELTSIREIPEDERWQDRRWRIGDHTWSLDEIEHQEIRPKFREPRVHFALVCAAVSCPPLRTEAYDGDRIEAQLEDQTRYVHDHRTWFRFDRERGVVHLTPLYDWFAGDFEEVADSVLDFAARYSRDLESALDAGKEPEIEWLEYDWDLNSRAHAVPR